MVAFITSLGENLCMICLIAFTVSVFHNMFTVTRTVWQLVFNIGNGFGWTSIKLQDRTCYARVTHVLQQTGVNYSNYPFSVSFLFSGSYREYLCLGGGRGRTRKDGGIGGEISA